MAKKIKNGRQNAPNDPEIHLMNADANLHQMIEFDADPIKDVIPRARSIILTTGGAVTRIFEILISKYLENGQSERKIVTDHSIAYAPRNM